MSDHAGSSLEHGQRGPVVPEMVIRMLATAEEDRGSDVGKLLCLLLQCG